MGNSVQLAHVTGLRGIAILLVVWFHFTTKNGVLPEWLTLPNGYYGVDVFLAIMGYFLVLGFANKPELTLSQFVRSKFNRILPPLAVLVLVTALLSLVVLNWQVYRAMCKTGCAAIFGVSFSLYLIHMPLLVLYKGLMFDAPGILAGCLLLLLSVLFAFAYYYAVEKRRISLWSGCLCCAGTVLVCATGFFKDWRRSLPDAVEPRYTDWQACAPDWNLFDYCIGQYDPSMISDRYLCGFDFLDEYQQVYNHHRAPIAKQHFCNFIYSNSGGHPYREKLFNIVSHYKSVHSLGTFLHNYDGDGMNCRNEKGKNNAWYFSGVDLRKPYKFTIVAENACFRGYTSEKIALAYLSDSVPIYWGDPLTENIYNPESFINANNLTEEELIERVRILDNNQKELENMLRIPAILSHQYETRMQHVNKSTDKLIRILLQPEQVKGAGTYMRLYLNSLISQKPGLKMLLKELKQEVQSRILKTNAVKHRS